MRILITDDQGKPILDQEFVPTSWELQHDVIYLGSRPAPVQVNMDGQVDGGAELSLSLSSRYGHYFIPAFAEGLKNDG